MEKSVDTAENLRYLDAHSVRCPAGDLSRFRVCTEDEENLGNVNGVLISPSTRQVRYYVIQTPGLLMKRRYLLPVEAGATVEEDHMTLRIGARKDELDLQSYTPRSVQNFSDDDLLTAMFSAA